MSIYSIIIMIWKIRWFVWISLVFTFSYSSNSYAMHANSWQEIQNLQIKLLFKLFDPIWFFLQLALKVNSYSNLDKCNHKHNIVIRELIFLWFFVCKWITCKQHIKVVEKLCRKTTTLHFRVDCSLAL